MAEMRDKERLLLREPNKHKHKWEDEYYYEDNELYFKCPECKGYMNRDEIIARTLFVEKLREIFWSGIPFYKLGLLLIEEMWGFFFMDQEMEELKRKYPKEYARVFGNEENPID